jgi:hypothetical protein
VVDPDDLARAFDAQFGQPPRRTGTVTMDMAPRSARLLKVGDGR